MKQDVNPKLTNWAANWGKHTGLTVRMLERVPSFQSIIE